MWSTARSESPELPVPIEICPMQSARRLRLRFDEVRGHTEDGMALYVPWARTLIAGDHLSPVEIPMLGDFPAFAGFLFQDVSLDGQQLDPAVLAEAESVLREVEPFTAEQIEAALRELAERLELKPRDAFQPIRIAVTGSKVSPGLFESLELLGRDKALERLSAARS